MKLLCHRYEIDLNAPKVMGILNITPDSFSDGGRNNALDKAVAHARQMVADGVDIIDVGGESTRPGAAPVSPEEEWQRVAPVLEAIQSLACPISVDTRRTYVMQKTLENGLADLINDVSALEDDGALSLLAAYPDIPICLMHKKGNPENMQKDPHYQDVVQEVTDYLHQRVDTCIQAGIERKRLIIDPGFGFGKTSAHNIELMKTMQQWRKQFDLPILIGFSRKHTLGLIAKTNDPEDRVSASVAAALASCARGAKIVRVHDVRQTVHALRVWQQMGVFV